MRGGLELALGLHRDPEMGLIVMAGSGGVLLELTKDVAFCALPVSREKARDLIARTRAGRLIDWNNGATDTPYAYDKSGNRTQSGSKTFVYDERNRLVSGGGSTYTYTARGTLATRN